MRSRKRKRKLMSVIRGAVIDEDHFVCRIIEAQERTERIRDAGGFVVSRGENRYKRQGRVILQCRLLLTPHHACIGKGDENAPPQSHEACQRAETIHAVRAERRTLQIDALSGFSPQLIRRVKSQKTTEAKCDPEKPRR